MSGTAARVRSVQVGTIGVLTDEGPRAGTPTAFRKYAVTGPVQAGPLGLDGDAQADLKVHGGPDKAVYAYPWAHYAVWEAAHPRLAGRLRPGAFGENLTVEGLDETVVALGDRYAVGGAVLEVSEPRQPCYKFAHIHDDTRLGKYMLAEGMTGWYLRVLTPGPIAAGDAVTLLDRPHPSWTVRRLSVVVTGQGGERPGREALAELGAIDALPAYLRRDIARALAR